MLPLVSGGGCETFWDDQQGCYFNYIKRDGSYNTGDYPNYGRSTTMFGTRKITKPWPFNKVPNPYFEGWPFPAVTGEGTTVFGPDIFDPDRGQVFRSRPQKYERAPDTYVAFLLRNGQTDMAVSRDAVRWKPCSEKGLGYYLSSGKTVDGRAFAGGEITNGIVRRGDEIWQYANCRVGGQPATVRVTQRLDGFLSLDAGPETGTVITRPFVFEGSKLVLNADAKGWVKVAVLNLPGREMSGFNIGLTGEPETEVTGFGIGECDPIRADSVWHVVTWQGSFDVGNLAGQVVRLRFEMQDTKLYAFKFD